MAGSSKIWVLVNGSLGFMTQVGFMTHDFYKFAHRKSCSIIVEPEI